MYVSPDLLMTCGPVPSKKKKTVIPPRLQSYGLLFFQCAGSAGEPSGTQMVYAFLYKTRMSSGQVCVRTMALSMSVSLEISSSSS